MTRSIHAVLLAVLVAAIPASADIQLRLVGSMARHFAEPPSAGEAIDALGRPDQGAFYGPGWEILLDRVGIGGNYLVRFFEDDARVWWVDWAAETVFVSYHVFGAGRALDPFIHIGLGTAGRSLADDDGRDRDPEYVSVFPMLAAGLGLDLDGFLIGGRFTYMPEIGPPPAADVGSSLLERYQVALYGGVAIGGRHERRHRHSFHAHWD